MFWTKSVSVLVVALGASLVAQAPPPPEPRVWIENDSAIPRDETVRVSVPFPMGQIADAPAISLGSFTGPAVVLLRWRDGSVKLAQAHVPVQLGPRQRRSFAVTVADAGEMSGDWPFDEPLPMHTELEDAWGRVYRASLEVGEKPVFGSSESVRIRRVRGVHRREGSEFLPLVGYLTEVRGESRGELTVVLDNGAYRPDTNFGPVRFRAFGLVSSSKALRFRPRFATENAIRPALSRPDGFFQRLLGPMDGLYLGDFTAKSFRFDLFLANEDGNAAQQRVAASEPLSAWSDLDWVRYTRAFGAHGGPAPVYLDVSAARWREWRAGARFGPFAGHGDPEDAAEQGTPRNGSCNLHNLLRWQSPDLLKAAETIVLQHTLRPTSGFVARRPADMVAFRSGLSDRSIERPHGFTALDYEHFSVDLIYDYYWLTGDPLARDELRRAGIGLRRLLEGLPFITSRGEGWTMQAGALIAAATRDRELLDSLAERARTDVLPRIEEPPTPVALEQPPHSEAFGEGEKFDAPWQMAALVHGLHAIYDATGDVAFADAGVRTARIMAGPGWLDEVGPKYLVSARQAGRYIMPVGFAPMEGTARMEMGAFVLAAEMTEDPQFRVLFDRRAATLAREHAPFENESFASNVWSQLFLDRRERL